MTDSSGTRRATLFIRQGTAASLAFADGSTQPITTLSVRATEYTVGANGPAAMPGPLPPTSAYTYAAEFSADEAEAAGATTVRFSQPVIQYLENFLGFPVGIEVPEGGYDRTTGLWVAADNGRIVKLLSVTNGLANLDLDGSGQPASATALAALGVSDAERGQLATLYAVGQTLWRVPIPHFSAWDSNWGFGPPPDATPPPPPPPPPPPNPPDGAGDADAGPECSQNSPPDEQPGSIIGCLRQTLGEEVPVTGTPFRLRYASDRVPGRVATKTAPVVLSGATVPASLKRIDLSVEVGGQHITETFPAAPNQTTTFTWDGKDPYGRTLQGTQIASVEVGFVYDGIYERVPRFGYNGNGLLIGGSRTRQEVTLHRRQNVALRPWDARADGLGGWTLDVHHSYDPLGQLVYLGNGQRRGAWDVRNVLVTLAGTGLAGQDGDGGLATAAQLNFPTAVAAAPDGSFYIADQSNQEIRRISANGIITTIVGFGIGNYADGGPPRLNYPSGVTVGSDGSIYLTDSGNNRIRRVGPDGVITTVAGTGVAGFSGDGGPATAAQIFSPGPIALGPDGTLYFADDNQRVRRVGTDGIIATVAGTGAFGSSGDGGPATAARLAAPSGLAVGPDGSLYISDTLNNRIRRVTADGIIRTVVGTGTSGFAGDGGPATAAQLLVPKGIAVAADGRIYIADAGNARLRLVGTDGIIRTAAGTGTAGGTGDNGPAAAARLNQPTGVGIGPQGLVYVTDTFNHRLRRVGPALPGLAATDNILIPSEDGAEIYVFDEVGRHLQTLEALTAAVRYTFSYDAAGRLSAVTDANANVTRMERDPVGNLTAIVAPGGQRTAVTLDANGYLARVANPANETTQFDYTPDGLLSSLTDPRNNLHTFRYDALGRLTLDSDPAGGSQSPARTETASGHSVTVTSALNRTRTYDIAGLSGGSYQRVNTAPSGLRSTTVVAPDGTQITTPPDGQVTSFTSGPDPRFGMQAPVSSTIRITTPAGLVSTLTETRSATLADPLSVLSLTAATVTRTLNGKTYTRTFDAGTRRITDQTPMGRQRVSTLDSQGRLVSEQVAPLEPVTYGYDVQGRLHTITQGTGPAARVYTVEYDTKNRLSTITDPLSHTSGLGYDDADRVTTETFPDTKVVAFGYDANGNVASVTPPARPAHAFDYTPVNLEATYTPPAIGGRSRRHTRIISTASSPRSSAPTGRRSRSPTSPRAGGFRVARPPTTR